MGRIEKKDKECPACAGSGKVPAMIISFDEPDVDGNRKMRERYDWMPCAACGGKTDE